MTPRQQAFHRQARSDWDIFRHLHPFDRAWPPSAWGVVSWLGTRHLRMSVCHELHYLQMCTEKLAKAYYRTLPGRLSHSAFRRFTTDLMSNPNVLKPLGFNDLAALTRWHGSVVTVIGAVEDLAPANADRLGLPNPEYPWPRNAPATAPVEYNFHAEVFSHLDAQRVCGEPRFLTVLDRIVNTLPNWCL